MESLDTIQPCPKTYDFSDSWTRGLHEVIKDMKGSASEIEYLARALNTVGNSELAYKLFNIADQIRGTGEGVQDFISYKLDTDSRQVQESSTNILKACLATLDATEISKKVKESKSMPHIN